MASSLPAKKILVVDGDPIIRGVLSAALKSEGYEVFPAVDGPAAFTVVLQEQPDLILLDIFFPPDVFQSGNTWDAFLIMHWLQCMGGPQANRTPVFVISGAEPGEFKDRCLAAGAANYFQKPVKIPDLLDAIHRIFHPSAGDVPLSSPAGSNYKRERF
jgi:CheY-like chemotaxis protein